jgi:hypothetical protein
MPSACVASVIPEHSNSTYINSHTSDTDPLLHDLQPDDQLYATTGVQFTAAYTEQHRIIGVRACRLALVNDTILDILELCFSPDGISSFATAQAAEDVACFFVSSNFC